MIRIGVDLGGTKIESVALDEDGTELARKRIATPRDSYPEIVRAVSDLVQTTEASLLKKALVGVGMPGSISPRTGLVRNANLQPLNGHPFHLDLSQALGRHVRVENDANCFAVSEAADGAGKDGRVVFGVILGTGCGGGFVVNGKILTGHNAIGGEWGHNPLPWMEPDEYPGPACYCGRRGCIETFISGTGFSRDYQNLSGQKLKGEEIVALESKGVPDAVIALFRYVDRLARSLASVINVIDPDVIVLGGGMSNVGALYERVPRFLPKYTFSDGVETPIRRSLHGDSGGVRGAAWLWSSEEAGRLVAPPAP